MLQDDGLFVFILSLVSLGVVVFNLWHVNAEKSVLNLSCIHDSHQSSGLAIRDSAVKLKVACHLLNRTSAEVVGQSLTHFANYNNI